MPPPQSTFNGADTLVARLNRMADIVRKPDDFLNEVLGLMQADVLTNFQTGSSPDGQPWLPPVYRSGSPLIDTYALMEAAAHGGAGWKAKVSGTSVSMAVDGRVVPYAAAMNYGHTYNVPARSRARPWVFEVNGRLIYTTKIRSYSFTVPARRFMGFGRRLVGAIRAALLRRVNAAMGRP